jgi:ectoine hydroxylase-related dioxygenase (phytanoyl-CoA dioxygenase family)
METALKTPAGNMISAEEKSPKELAKFYFDNGYVVVPGVLSPEEVAELRADLRPKFDRPVDQRNPGDTVQYLFDPFSHYEKTRKIILHPRTIAVVTEILGERPALVREFAAQLKNYSGWHKDTTCLERAGLTYHWDKDFSFMTFTCYLQDNDPIKGGGLDVAPGSWTWPDRYVDAKPHKETRRPSFWDKLLGRKTEIRSDYGYEIKGFDDFFTIPSKAGDLILFNRKIDHRATVNSTGEDYDKMGIFGSFSRNDKHLQSYHDFIGHRADYHYLKVLNYPADLVADAKAAGLDIF